MLWQSCYWCPDFWTDLNRCWSLKCFFLRKPNQLCPVSRFKSGLRLPGMNKTLPGHDSDPDLGRTWHVAVVQNAWLNSVCFFVGITWNHTNSLIKTNTSFKPWTLSAPGLGSWKNLPVPGVSKWIATPGAHNGWGGTNGNNCFCCFYLVFSFLFKRHLHKHPSWIGDSFWATAAFGRREAMDGHSPNG